MHDGHFDDAADRYAAMMTEPWHVLRRRSAVANLTRHKPIEGLWIDLGAGTGEGAQLLAAAGARVVAVDPAATMSSALLNLAAWDRRITAAAPTELAQYRGKAAGVTLHNVIEFADDRAELIRTAAECLQPDGLLSIVCANPLFTLYRHAIRGATPPELLNVVSARQIQVGMPDSRFGVYDYTVDDCIRDATPQSLSAIDHRGVRVVSDLAPHHPSQRAGDWTAGMLELEELLGGREPYRSTSRHWQLIYRKESSLLAGRDLRVDLAGSSRNIGTTDRSDEPVSTRRSETVGLQTLRPKASAGPADASAMRGLPGPSGAGGSTDIRVLVVDDNALLRIMVGKAVGEAAGMLLVGECIDGADVAAAGAALHPDVVVMDVQMPLTSGIEAARLLRETQPAVRVLMHTASADRATVAQAADAGAAGLLRKDGQIDRLVASIATVAAGGQVWPDHLKPRPGG